MSKQSGNIHDYTDLASNYDATRYQNLIETKVDSLRKDAFLHFLELDPLKTNLLDVGTGTGSGIEFFADKVSTMTGLDGTQAMLDYAQKKLDKNNIKNTKLVCADALNIPFDNNSFDVVTSLNFIHLFAPSGLELQGQFLAEMARVVKDNGSVVVEFDNKAFLELGNRYSDLDKMTNTLRVNRIIGTYLPKIKKLFRISDKLARKYSRLVRFKIFKPYAYKWVVEFKKSPKSSAKSL